jgi:hypothetical protein
MSTFNDVDITCEQCGEEFRGTIWTAVHAKQDPELKDLLLGGELNMVMCPQCSHVAYQDHFVLYQDPAAELIVYVYPGSQREDEASLKAMMLQGFKEAQAVYDTKDRFLYEPLLLFGLNTLVEMLQEEENRAEQSQIAQELCKEKGISFHLLRPSQARAKGMMRVVPYEPSAPKITRNTVLAGIEHLIKINPQLDLYVKLKGQIESDAQWNLEGL